jgi:hypothetical protein
MRPRVPSSRVILATGASALLLVALAGPVGAGQQELFSIEVDLDAGDEAFVGFSPLVCASGEAITDFGHGSGTETSRANTFHLAKEIVCPDGSFWIRLDASANFVARNGTVGGWTVIKGSGSGAYEGLTGAGQIVGEFLGDEDEPIDIIDHYYGWLRQ